MKVRLAKKILNARYTKKHSFIVYWLHKWYLYYASDMPTLVGHKDHRITKAIRLTRKRGEK